MMQSFLDDFTDMEKDEELWKLSMDESEFIPATQANIYSSLSKEQATCLAVQAFKAAAEREISVGDGVQIFILSKAKDMSTNDILQYSVEAHIVSLPSH